MQLSSYREPGPLVRQGLGVAVFLACVLLGLLAKRALGLDLLAWLLWIAGGLVTVVYYAVPPLQPRIYSACRVVGAPIAAVVVHVLLAAIFFLVLTPLGLACRLLRIDLLRRRTDKEAATYWIDRKGPPERARNYRQS